MIFRLSPERFMIERSVENIFLRERQEHNGAWHTTMEKKKKRWSMLESLILILSCIESTAHIYCNKTYTWLTYEKKKEKKHNTELQKTIAWVCISFTYFFYKIDLWIFTTLFFSSLHLTHACAENTLTWLYVNHWPQNFLGNSQ